MKTEVFHADCSSEKSEIDQLNQLWMGPMWRNVEGGQDVMEWKKKQILESTYFAIDVEERRS